MADQNFKLLFEFIAKTAQFNLNIDRAKSKIDKFSQQATRTGKFLSTRLSLPLLAVGTLAVRQAAKFERLQVTLNTLNGSAEEGAKAFKRLVQFSAETPLQLEELTRVNNMLMGFGQTSDDAFKSLKMLGDVAAVSGGNLTGIAVAFGQAAAEGRVMTRDLRQFINNGVPILDILAKSMGVARSEIMNLASEGKLSFKVLQDGFEFATGSQGRFNNGLKILSQTLEGLFSTLKDNVNIALAELGQEIATTLNLKEGIPALSKKIGELVKRFKNLDDDTQKFIINASLMAAAIPPIIMVLGLLTSSLVTIVTTVMALNPLITALIFVLGTLSTTFLTARASGISFGETLKNLVKSKGSGGLFAALQAGSLAAKLELDALKKSMEGVIGPLQKGQTRNLQNLLFPGATTASTSTATTNLTGSGDEAMGGGLLGINPFKLGTGLQTVIGLLNNDLPKSLHTASTETAKYGLTWQQVMDKSTMVTNGFSTSMQTITQKITDFKENAIIPLAEELKKNNDMIMSFATTIGTTLVDSFANLGEGEDAFKKIGEQLEALIKRLLVAAALSAIIGAVFGLDFRTVFAALSGMGSMMSPVPNAKGGIYSGPTNALVGEYPGARSNPEVIAPLNKLKGMLGNSGGAMQGEFVLRGQDLVVALQRAERNRNRFK